MERNMIRRLCVGLLVLASVILALSAEKLRACSRVLWNDNNLGVDLRVESGDLQT
jgi:hypothetical protein